MKHKTYKIYKKLFSSLSRAAGTFILAYTAFISVASAEQKAVCINAAPDYSSGAFSVLSTGPVGGPREIQNDINPTVSDLGLNTYGQFFYVIERYFGDNISKYDISDPSTPIWQYSVMDGNDTVSSSNPYAIVFAGPEKAYVIRNNTFKSWIVNPEATSQEDFKIGALDLEAYKDQDDIGPEMISGIVVKNKLFIIMQRLNQNDNWTPNDAYMAVFDTATDQEITTGKGGSLNGILLPVKNPNTILYEPFSDLIYVSAQGQFESSYSGTPAEYSGGIVSIDPDTYETTLVLDDGDDTDHPYGNINKMTILSQDKGYFIGYAGWGDNTLYEFNPATGAVTGPVNDWLKNKNISAISAGADGDANGMLWVGNSTDAEIVIINPADNSIDETLSTNLSPQKIVFVNDDILQARISEDGLLIDWSFSDVMSSYTLLYALLPFTDVNDIFYMDLSILENPTQWAIQGLPDSYSVMAVIKATRPDGTTQYSNIVTIIVP